MTWDQRQGSGRPWRQNPAGATRRIFDTHPARHT